MVGAYGADPNHKTNAGMVYIILGGTINNTHQSISSIKSSTSNDLNSDSNSPDLIRHNEDLFLSNIFSSSNNNDELINNNDIESKPIVFVISGNIVNDNLGKGLSNLGDIDHDGYTDIIISSIGK